MNTVSMLLDYDLIDRVWDLLADITTLTSEASPGAGSRTLWRGHGVARVDVESTVRTRRFAESGRFWPGGSATPVTTRNAYLWQRDAGSLLLSHERLGREAPVFLLRLSCVGRDTLEGSEPHQCGQDQYHATLNLMDDGFRLDWAVKGPSKNERLSLNYRMRGPRTQEGPEPRCAAQPCDRASVQSGRT